MSGKQAKKDRQHGSGGTQLKSIEAALVEYEAYCQWMRASALAGVQDIPITNAFEHAQTFRSSLLSVRPGDAFDGERFALPAVASIAREDYVSSVAIAVHSWCADSRRVYQLDPNLQLLLSATGFGGACLGDIRFPFTSFAIQLEIPIESGGLSYDCLLVSRLVFGGCAMLHVQLMAKELTETSFAFKKLAERLTHAVETKNQFAFQQVAKDHDRLFEGQLDNGLLAWLVRIDQPPETPIEDIVQTAATGQVAFLSKPVDDQERDELRDRSRHLLNIVLRLVFGIPLYLASVPNAVQVTKLRQVAPTPRASKHQTHLITDGAQICTVSTSYKLSTDERRIFILIMNEDYTGGRVLTVHFRTGHWRRPPGQGHDPLAIKTVWVRPALVKFQDLPDGALAPGVGNKLG